VLCHNTYSILNECAHTAPNWLPEKTMQAADNRSPNPPMGYACECSLTTDQQIDLVAEFHVHRIRPSRIAYRLGIDIAQVEAWLSGEQDSERFQRLIAAHKRRNIICRCVRPIVCAAREPTSCDWPPSKTFIRASRSICEHQPIVTTDAPGRH